MKYLKIKKAFFFIIFRIFLKSEIKITDTKKMLKNGVSIK